VPAFAFASVLSLRQMWFARAERTLGELVAAAAATAAASRREQDCAAGEEDQD
jgi:hypothetical protein